MNNKNFDFNKILDSVIDTTKEVTENLIKKGGEFIKDSGLEEFKDFYPFYNWPPLNLYCDNNNSLIFEFGLPGFIKDGISIDFDGDYMILNASLSNLNTKENIVKTYKSKLKLTNIENQRYYVPKDRYNHKNYIMHMKNGLLRIVFNQVEEEL